MGIYAGIELLEELADTGLYAHQKLVVDVLSSKKLIEKYIDGSKNLDKSPEFVRVLKKLPNAGRFNVIVGNSASSKLINADFINVLKAFDQTVRGQALCAHKQDLAEALARWDVRNPDEYLISFFEQGLDNSTQTMLLSNSSIVKRFEDLDSSHDDTSRRLDRAVHFLENLDKPYQASILGTNMAFWTLSNTEDKTKVSEYGSRIVKAFAGLDQSAQQEYLIKNPEIAVGFKRYGEVEALFDMINDWEDAYAQMKVLNVLRDAESFLPTKKFVWNVNDNAVVNGIFDFISQYSFLNRNEFLDDFGWEEKLTEASYCQATDFLVEGGISRLREHDSDADISIEEELAA